MVDLTVALVTCQLQNGTLPLLFDIFSYRSKTSLNCLFRDIKKKECGHIRGEFDLLKWTCVIYNCKVHTAFFLTAVPIVHRN